MSENYSVNISDMTDVAEYQKVTGDQIVLTFPVLWEGWDCDDVGYVFTNSENKPYLIMTNHGRICKSKIDTLLERVDYYTMVIEATKAAINILNTR